MEKMQPETRLERLRRKLMESEFKKIEETAMEMIPMYRIEKQMVRIIDENNKRTKKIVEAMVKEASKNMAGATEANVKKAVAKWMKDNGNKGYGNLVAAGSNAWKQCFDFVLESVYPYGHAYPSEAIEPDEQWVEGDHAELWKIADRVIDTM